MCSPIAIRVRLYGRNRHRELTLEQSLVLNVVALPHLRALFSSFDNMVFASITICLLGKSEFTLKLRAVGLD